MPGEMALGTILWEYQVHGWDLARATGQPWHPPAAAAEQSLSFAPTMLTDDTRATARCSLNLSPYPRTHHRWTVFADCPADALIGPPPDDPLRGKARPAAGVAGSGLTEAVRLSGTYRYRADGPSVKEAGTNRQ